MSQHFADIVLRWRYLLMITMLGLFALTGSGVQHLSFSNDYRVFFSSENPQLRAFEELQNTYTKNDNIMFVLAPRDGKVFTHDTLAAVEWLTEESWQIPYSIRVDSISNFQHTYSEGDDELVVEDLVYEAENLTDEDIARIKDVALHEPQLVDRLIAPDADVTGVNVTVQLPGIDQMKEGPAAVEYARGLRDQFVQKYPDIDVHITGMIMMNNSFSEQTQVDSTSLIPMMFGVIFLVMVILLRSFSGTLGIFIVMIMSILSALGIAGWLGVAITPPSATSPTIIATLAVANGVHLLSNFLHGMRHGSTKFDAMHESVRINVQPIFLTTLTTAIGFLSMNFSDAPPFRDLGNIVAMGVVAAFLYSMLLLPGVMMLLPVSVKLRPEGQVHGMDRLADFVVARRNFLLVGMGILVITLVSMIPRNELNDEFVKYFDQTIDFRIDTDFATDHLTGIYTIEYSLPAGGSNGISDPAYLRSLADFTAWLREQPEVMHVNTLSDTMKRLNMNMHGDDPAWYRLPEERNLAAQYLLLYEMSLPYGLDLNNQINLDKSATRLIATLKSLSSNQMLAFEDRAGAWLQENAPLMFVEGASPSIMFSHIGKRNIHSMLIGTTIALVLISLVLLFALRSVKIGFISLIPNLVPAAMGFGMWGLMVGRVGLALSVVASMTLGIVVDDTVHFLSKYLRAKREQGKDATDAVRYAFHTVGTALWVTSLVLAAGFLVLSQSSFEINSSMGLLTAITIMLALAADFFLLPSLLMTLDSKPVATRRR